MLCEAVMTLRKSWRGWDDVAPATKPSGPGSARGEALNAWVNGDASTDIIGMCRFHAQRTGRFPHWECSAVPGFCFSHCPMHGAAKENTKTKAAVTRRTPKSRRNRTSNWDASLCPFGVRRFIATVVSGFFRRRCGRSQCKNKSGGKAPLFKMRTTNRKVRPLLFGSRPG